MSAVATATTAAVVSSAVVAAIVGGLSSFLTQRYLLVRKAQIDYESMARQRLYETIGPLRMQLLLAARDLVHRINAHVQKMQIDGQVQEARWGMDPADYYVRSTIYRLLRPLALAQLIERAMGTADFSVDPAAVDLLKFAATSERMLTGDVIVRTRATDGTRLQEHPDVDWTDQTQHLFRDNLRAAAARLIDDDMDRPQVISFSDFESDIPDLVQDHALAPLASIFFQFQWSMTENPIFWLRLVGYAYR